MGEKGCETVLQLERLEPPLVVSELVPGTLHPGVRALRQAGPQAGHRAVRQLTPGRAVQS